MDFGWIDVNNNSKWMGREENAIIGALQLIPAMTNSFDVREQIKLTLTVYRAHTKLNFCYPLTHLNKEAFL